MSEETTRDETEDDGAGADEAAPQETDPVRKWTLRLLVIALVLLVFYLVADRITPMSTQARVHALVVPVAAEVSGRVVDVSVSRNQFVAADDVLFRIDATNYELAVVSAEANLESARQATGASAANIDAAEAAVRKARASLKQSEQDAARLRRIKEQDAGAISDRRLESAETSVIVSRENLAAALANLEQARQNLGEAGEANSRIEQARAALDQARLNLEKTAVRAPTNGVVTDVRVDKGNFAGAGAPMLTFISTDDIWVQADFTENNLGHVDVGDDVEIVFDVYPGRVFDGSVREVGFGVSVDSAPLGSLPTIQNDREWLRDAQRFPVVVGFEMEPDQVRRLRVGAQASVIVYASDNFLFNLLGKLYVRVTSWMSYAY